ncbi:MAG TPA: SGNH/GDSL hydrolase family protein [Phycisphaerales bacterium]|nr:SGNH/GDSL hydrolase family protein [Phycisphaerales bacterium]
MKSSRWKRLAIRFAILLVILLIASELFARFYLGLGDPPLMIHDSKIEYMFKPSMTYHRFGNLIRYNQWSMRSDDFPEKKGDSREFRILVVGDSVVNGGSQTDQSKLATSILQNRLHDELNRPVVVGNISAGSWGPPNQLAYIDRFGVFDADAVAIVFSSHDAADVPTFAPFGADAPEHSPILALQEIVQRYRPIVMQKLGLAGTSPGNAKSPRDPLDEKDRDESLADVRTLVEKIKNAGIPVVVFLHFERDESIDNPYPGHDDLQKAVQSCGVEVRQLGPAFRKEIELGHNPYRDSIHPNDVGQKVMEQAIEAWVMEVMKAKSPTTQPVE